MKVVLQRDLYLEGVLYKASPRGTEIPDKIGNKTVRIQTKEDTLKRKKHSADIAAQGFSEEEEPVQENVITLPEDAKEYKEPTATSSGPAPDTLSGMTPPPPPSRPSEPPHTSSNLKTTQKK